MACDAALNADIKENLLLDEIQNIVDNWLTDEMSFVKISETVAEFMKQQETTLVKAVWKNNKPDFYKLLSTWQKGKNSKEALNTLKSTRT